MDEGKEPVLPAGWFPLAHCRHKGPELPLHHRALNELWSTYRLRNMEPETRGYWDEYTDVMKDSYGIGHDFTGYFAFMNRNFDLALWCFDNALRYRQPQTLSRIYLMQAETRLALGDYSEAVNSYQECIRREASKKPLCLREDGRRLPRDERPQRRGAGPIPPWPSIHSKKRRWTASNCCRTVRRWGRAPSIERTQPAADGGVRRNRLRGLARQRESPTIQGTLEEKLGFICGHKVELLVAGRTDSGVHALGQTANFLTPSPCRHPA